ncbi:AzlC family ABC transporter permease [Paenibacillus dakarensis]|uniref:AzlC family ABC transporter permease n=1 Tax=Paenibacillus dakarensis TaxID=1527293 RepID=UPI0006D56C69|nr:AzlC family ABC transporter permease [Paenibacillus dakarensis]
MLHPLVEFNIAKKQHFLLGLKAGVPVAIGYIPIAITFGLLAKTSGIPVHAALMMSLLVYAGASQFIGVNLMAAGAAGLEIIITTFILNLRHFFMTASLSQRISKWTPKKWSALLAFGVTDETFSIASTQESRELHPLFLLGLNAIAFISWNIGSWIGIFLSAGLPPSVQSSMGIALYAMFIGLLTPSLKKSKPVLCISLIAVLIHSVLHWIIPMFIELSTGFSIIITTILSSAIGVLIFPEEGEPSE